MATLSLRLPDSIHRQLKDLPPNRKARLRGRALQLQGSRCSISAFGPATASTCCPQAAGWKVSACLSPFLSLRKLRITLTALSDPV